MVSYATNAFRKDSILLRDTAHVSPKTFADIRIQDWHPLLCAKNTMNVYAGKGVCHTQILLKTPRITTEIISVF